MIAVGIVVFLFDSLYWEKVRDASLRPMPCPGELMNQNLSQLLFVFLRFHTLEIGNLAVDKSLDAGPVDGKPFHAVGIGDDEVES